MSFGIYGYSSAETFHRASARDLESGAIVRKGFTTDMAAHVWAQRRQTFGQSGKGVVYFHGRALFSYGSHFCTAWLCADGDTVLLNSSSPSITTSGHVSTAYRAVRHRKIIDVPNLTELLAGEKHLEARCAQWGDVERLKQWESAIEERLANRAHVRRFCVKHAGELSRNALEFLLAGVGLSRSADKIQRDHADKAAREKREREASRRREAVKELRAFASAPDLAAYLISKRTHFGGQSPEALADYWAGRIRKARNWAGKANVPAGVWREAWNRLQALNTAHLIEAIAQAQGLAEHKALMHERRTAVKAALRDWRGVTPEHRLPGPDAGEFRKLAALRSHLERRAGYAEMLARALRARYPNAHGGTADKLEAAADCLYNLAQNVQDSDAFKAARARFDAERIEAERVEREAKERKRAEALAAWLAGESVYVSARRESGAAYIRAVGVERNASGDITGGRLETSQGADVPLVESVRAFRFIKLVRERGQAWHANGKRVRVGHFEIDRICADGTMRAGCHLFEWRDVEALARELGVFELTPDDSAVIRRAHA